MYRVRKLKCGTQVHGTNLLQLVPMIAGSNSQCSAKRLHIYDLFGAQSVLLTGGLKRYKIILTPGGAIPGLNIGGPAGRCK